MAPKTIVITGASDGVGAAAARRLAADGHHVVPVGRSLERTAAVAEEIGSEYFTADFTDLGQVRSLASDLLQRYPEIDVLANNAGAIFGKERQTTVDGHEMTFQVNYLAPFLLTRLLTNRLLESKGTVINTSSAANRLFAKLDITDLEEEKDYTPQKAYGNSKLEQILFTEEFDRRYRAAGATSTAFHPGVIGSSFSSAEGSAMRSVYQGIIGRFLQSPEKGAKTLVFLAEGTPGADYPTGTYFVRSKPARANKLAGDHLLALDLWNRSVAMLEG
ncbi:SDR family NAD(P)-dependent oxidoreductase [Arthrobacter sp. BL-252-APC-1A]|uniref:SDR family NAD(P)-dependent oxidoreductase n=1 Tax=Arthrobacter sp. BL-252-APC-1A TaxID=2606622 RepID=UPI0013119D19|nr:SDR family NAD(P)-dependent oxidoreductase [Arthrobacter sp. BL-252-APC-1A]MSR97433.1 SDR family NAD(P)-dependent oxidoreductase [Arthrobacter sp. BL-252-APC-1A]